MKVKLVLIGSVAAGLLFLKVITPEVYHGYDAGFYGAMSRELISSNPRTTTAPYSYRVLPPWLLHPVPLETETAFAIYNLVLTLVSSYLLFLLLLESGASPGEAGFGVFFFLISWVNARFGIFYPVHIDGTYYLILILAFLALFRKNDVLFLAALAAGVLTREYTLSLIPVYYFFRKKKDSFLDREALWKTFRIAAIPVVLFFLPRLLIPKSNPDFSYWNHAGYFARMFFVHWRRVGHSYLNVYGVAVFILVVNLPFCIRYLKKNSYLAAYLLFSIFFLMTGGADLCRINFISFPAVLILAAAAMKKHRSIYRRWVMIGFLIAAQLCLMRVFHPMTTDNYREIWWSNVSFCPEHVFRQSSLRYGLVGASFVAIYSGLSLRGKRSAARLPRKP